MLLASVYPRILLKSIGGHALFVKKIWTDSVWSKVIASGITTGLGALFVVLFRDWELSKDAGSSILRVASVPVVVPAWLATVLVILLLGLASFAVQRGRNSGGSDEDAVEPNAVPIIEATIVAPSFLGGQSLGTQGVVEPLKRSTDAPCPRLDREIQLGLNRRK